MFCIVKGCPFSVEKCTDPDVVFYPLPWHNIQLRTEWVKVAGYDPFNANDVKHITKDHRVCSVHFDNVMLNLSFSKQQMLMPTLFLPKVESQKKKKPISFPPTLTPTDEIWLKIIQHASLTRISPPLLKPVTCYIPPKPTPAENNPIPEKRIKIELDSDSCIPEEKSNIALNSVTIKSEPVEFAQSLESAMPIESAQPLESAKPIESAQPLESAKPIESAQPLESAKPIESAQPLLESAKPIESAQPLESAKPIESAQPLESAKPIESAQPLESAKPIESAQPLESAKPIESAQPFESTKPIESAQPLELAEPIESAQPLESAKPIESAQLLESVEPVNSSLQKVSTQTPSIPSKPSKRIIIVCNHHRSLMTNLSYLWKAGKLCDATISNGATHLKVHQIVLSAASPKMLRIFDRVYSDKGLTVTFPKMTSSEALTAFAEYLYNGVLHVDVRILEELKAIAQWLEMDDFEKLCEEQLKMPSVIVQTPERSEELSVESKAKEKQKDPSLDDSEDLNSDLGLVITSYSLANDDATMDTKEVTENSCLQVDGEREHKEEKMYVNKATNKDAFLPDSLSSNDRKVESVAKKYARSGASSSYLSFLSSCHSKVSSTLLTSSTVRPVGYIMSSSPLITKGMVNMSGTRNKTIHIDDKVPLIKHQLPIANQEKVFLYEPPKKNCA